MAEIFDIAAHWPEPEKAVRRIGRVAELELWIGVLRDELERRRRRKAAPLLSPDERRMLQSLLSADPE
ncbi:hypothetical protein GCM10011611_01920 [Aliidongia dinghuensis]|uniref:Uncharacterized protein n=1 Tax=Aliidongia dinghuensis TaxID=1867774 RepID=A0A8J2YPD0_9PROT|nr:hypothetical protein [Aliidongia dinghuensis]GGE99933.1 hypothetical protein GCM10011611_01920 [Aliidongia dinghuensis]